MHGRLVAHGLHSRWWGAIYTSFPLTNAAAPQSDAAAAAARVITTRNITTRNAPKPVDAVHVDRLVAVNGDKLVADQLDGRRGLAAWRRRCVCCVCARGGGGGVNAVMHDVLTHQPVAIFYSLFKIAIAVLLAQVESSC
jgi:hypothetical protein